MYWSIQVICLLLLLCELGRSKKQDFKKKTPIGSCTTGKCETKKLQSTCKQHKTVDVNYISFPLMPRLLLIHLIQIYSVLSPDDFIFWIFLEPFCQFRCVSSLFCITLSNSSPVFDHSTPHTHPSPQFLEWSVSNAYTTVNHCWKHIYVQAS